MTLPLKGRRYIYENPQARAYDLMEALLNPKIKAIFLNQGGDDAIRILPYIDFDIIREYPKIFMGFSDATIQLATLNLQSIGQIK